MHIIANKALIQVFSKFANFVDVLLLKLTVKLSEYTRNYNHIIDLVDDW